MNEGTLQYRRAAANVGFMSMLNNAGTVTHTATGNILGWQNATNSATINNLVDGVYDFQQGVLHQYSGTPVFNNEGLLRKTSDEIANIGFVLNLQDGSDVQVAAGTLNVTGGGSAFGSYAISQGDLRPSGGTFVLETVRSAAVTGRWADRFRCRQGPPRHSTMSLCWTEDPSAVRGSCSYSAKVAGPQAISAVNGYQSRNAADRRSGSTELRWHAQ